MIGLALAVYHEARRLVRVDGAARAVLEHARARLKHGDLGPEAAAEVEALRRLLYDEVRERGLPVE